MSSARQQLPGIQELEAVQVDGAPEPIRRFQLSVRSTTVELCTLGASVTRFLVGQGDKAQTDIVLGYKDVSNMYSSGNPVYFGTIVGRVANRIANGHLRLDEESGIQTHPLEINNPPNHLHGGEHGFSRRIWSVDSSGMVEGDDGGIPMVRFKLTSQDGDQGYPGSIEVVATYSLRPSLTSTGTTLRLEMTARLLDGKSTPINLAQHSYFNLSSQSDPAGILNHDLTVVADEYTPVDEVSIPTREVTSVKRDKAMDFTTRRRLREAIGTFGRTVADRTTEEVKEDMSQRTQLAKPYGFDHNYVVRKQRGISLPRAATLSCGQTHLNVYSDAPGVQVYTANYLGDNENDRVCKASYGPWSAVCLETQHYPDSILTSKDEAKDPRFEMGKCPILTPQSPNYKHCVEYNLEAFTNLPPLTAGSDTEGNKYDSIESMWAAQDLSSWYDRAMDYYEENCSTSVEGVLGGIGWITDIDLNGSRNFLQRLKLPSGTPESPTVACECGAGIGRVTKGLLLDICDKCDLVESSARLLSAAPEFIGDKSYKCRFYCSQLQEWEPAQGKYTVIWIQWVLCYLTDEDAVKFLRRCSQALAPGGVIVLKENTCVDEAFVVDVDDASLTRSLPYWKDLICKSGLRVVEQTWQDDFPEDIFPVPMLALQPIL